MPMGHFCQWAKMHTCSHAFKLYVGDELPVGWIECSVNCVLPM